MYCSNCGTQLKGTEKYCTNCGHPIERPIIKPEAKKEPQTILMEKKGHVRMDEMRSALQKEEKRSVASDKKERKEGIGIFNLLLIIVDIILLAFIIHGYSKTGADNIADSGQSDQEITNNWGYVTPSEEEDQEEQMISSENDETIDGEEEDSQSQIMSFDAEEAPTLDEFSWYMDGGYEYGLPSNAEIMTESESVSGKWKGMIWYDPDEKYGDWAVNLLNANIEISGNQAKIVLNLHEFMMKGENSNHIEEQMEFSGNYQEGSCFGAGAGNVRLDTFYMVKGMDETKQYAIGVYDSPDGTPAQFVLVRP